MKTLLWGLLVLVSTFLVGVGTAHATPEPAANGPQHVEVRLDQHGTLLADSRGQLEVRIEIDPAERTERGVRWDTGTPLRLRVAAPPEAKVDFETPEGWDHEVQLRVPIPADASHTLSVELPFRVGDLVKASDYDLTLDLVAPLVTGSGVAFTDAGSTVAEVRVDTPMGTKYLVLAVIAVVVFLFVVEWVRVDVVAILMMVSLPMMGLLNSRETFTGLSSNAVLAIIGVMVVSAGLNKVGLVSKMVGPVLKLAGRSAGRVMVFLSVLIAVISSVMQNTGAAVLFLPAIRNTCREIKTPISRILMPIGMCAILGGTLTMIGTSPLILLNDLLPADMETFGLLDLTPIGAALVLGGCLYFSTIGRALLAGASAGLKRITVVVPRRSTPIPALVAAGPAVPAAPTSSASPTPTQAAPTQAAPTQAAPTKSSPESYHFLDGPYELRVPKDFSVKDRPLTQREIRREYLVNIVALRERGGPRELAPLPRTRLRAGMRLCVYGPKQDVERFCEEYGIELMDPLVFRDLFNPAVAGVVEAVISPRSRLTGKTIRDVGFRKTFRVSAMALHQRGQTYYQQMADRPLVPGDAILMHGTWEHFQSLSDTYRNFVFTTPVDVETQKPGKAKIAAVVFAITLFLMFFSSFYYQGKPYNPIPLSVCLMGGALGMVLTGVIGIGEAYRSVDWRTVFLLGGLIPLGMAVDQTGTAEWIAISVVDALGESVTPLVLLIVLSLLANVFCLVISNVGACTLLVPLGISMAVSIGIDPRVAAIVVGLGVSNSFLLPTHQVNALYMGPGGYKTTDYLKIGGGMSILYNVILVSMVYFFYL